MEKQSSDTKIVIPDTSILLKYIRNAVNPEEKARVETWLNGNELHEKELLQIAALYYAYKTKERIITRDPLAAYQINERLQSRRKRVLWLKRVGAAAACIVAFVLLSLNFNTFLLDDSLLKNSQIITLESNPGIRTQFYLPDGSLVYLNSGSTISYPIPFDKNERRICLIGEAFFDVAPNPDLPFIVSLNNDRLEVQALGTEFNIQAYPNKEIVETTLASGLVSLKIKQTSGRGSHYQLSPLEKAIYYPDRGKIDVLSADVAYETAWKEGKLIFKNRPMPEVLEKLSTYYNVKFQVQNELINDYLFTGTFIDKQLFQVLEYLKIISNIQYKFMPVYEDDSREQKQTIINLWI